MTRPLRFVRPLPQSHLRLVDPDERLDLYRSLDEQEPFADLLDEPEHDGRAAAVTWFCILSATFAFWYFVGQAIRGWVL